MICEPSLVSKNNLAQHWKRSTNLNKGKKWAEKIEQRMKRKVRTNWKGYKTLRPDFRTASQSKAVCRIYGTSSILEDTQPSQRLSCFRGSMAIVSHNLWLVMTMMIVMILTKVMMMMRTECKRRLWSEHGCESGSTGGLKVAMMIKSDTWSVLWRILATMVVYLWQRKSPELVHACFLPPTGDATLQKSRFVSSDLLKSLCTWPADNKCFFLRQINYHRQSTKVIEETKLTT